MLLALILPLTASPLPTSGPATVCLPDAVSTDEVTEFTPPQPPIQVRVSTPLGRTLLLTDTDQDQGLSSFRWRGRDHCLGYGAQEAGTFVLVRGETREGVVILAATGTHGATIRSSQWRRSFGRLALTIQAQPTTSPDPQPQ